MARDIERILTQGIVFKGGTDDSVKIKTTSPFTINKRKGETISGSARMKAAYKARRSAKSSNKK